MPDESKQSKVNSAQQQSSAFPVLGENLTQLPEIPGGWKIEEYPIGNQSISIYCPAEPDLFLDEQDVIEKNKENDYMPFWTYLWPSAIQMAIAVENAPWKKGSHILELGSGLGLVGLAALARGDHVTFSDYDPTALHMCRMNAIKNNLPDPEVLLFDWREPIEGEFDAIFGCEVTYDAPMHTVILDLCDRMLKQDGVCWFGDPGRYLSPDFYRLANEHQYAVRLLNKDLQELKECGTEDFQIFELRKQ